MTIRTRSLAAAALTAALLVIVWGRSSGSPAGAHTPHPGLQFSLAIDGLDGCDTTGGDVTCTLPSGGPFTLQVFLDSLPDGVAQYEGFDLIVRHGGVTPNEDASNDDWPDCGFPANFYGDGFIGFGCAIGIPPAGPSSYTGVIGTNGFTCAQSGFVALLHGEGNTDLLESVAPKHAEGENTFETIIIVCGQVPSGSPGTVATPTPGPQGPLPGLTPSAGATPGAPAPTLEPTEAARATATARARPTSTPGGTAVGGPAGKEDEEDGGLDAWVIAVIVVAVVAGAGGLGYAGWRYYRSRQAQ